MFEDLLEKIAITLDKKGIPYMVIGGQAVLVYGEPRLIRDIDIADQSRFTVNKDRLAPDDHVGDPFFIKGDGDFFEEVFEHSGPWQD